VRLKRFRAATRRKEMIMELDDTPIDELVGAYPTCDDCGSTEVVRDAWAEWSQFTRDWALKSVFDEFACNTCGMAITPIWRVDKEFRKKRIRRLNDALRAGQCPHASIVVTAGVQARGKDFLAAVSGLVARFDQFSEDNDPHQEHDFGKICHDGETLFWKIDYFDLALQAHSPDPANPDVTHRVLTIMLASEY
jgi:hypothetical protein